MSFIGLDFGTHSVRGILFDTETRVTLKSATINYGTVDFDDGSCLFRDAEEWVRAGESVLQRLGGATRHSTLQGIGVTFTSCTIVPIREDGTPVASEEDDPHERPHVFPKMWRHHSPHAQRCATELTEAIAKSSARKSLDELYGGKLGLEWLHAKALEVYDLDRHAFRSTYAFVEAGDYVVWALTGRELPLSKYFRRSTQQAGFKACLVDNHQLVSDDIIRSIRPEILESDLKRINSHGHFIFVPPGTKVGQYSPSQCSKLKGVPVATASIDAHACAFGLGAFEKGRLVMVVGTSACFMMSCDAPSTPIRGAAGSIPDGIVSGLHSFEFGQSAAGDACAWLSRFTNTSLPVLETGALKLLEVLAANKQELECWAVDHFNGCRTPLMDGDAKASLRNLTLSTTPAHLFLAIVEALCFGIRVVVQILERGKVEIKDLVLAGGLSKSELFQVTLATVLDRPIIVFEDGGEASCRGAAAYATLMTSSSPNMVKCFVPKTFTIVYPKQELRNVFCGSHRFERYAAAANVKSFL